MFSFLKPLTVSVGSLSKVILLVATAIVVAISLFRNKCRFNLNSLWIFLVTAVLILGLFVCDFIFRNNTMLFENAYHFIINGIVPMFLLINVKDYKKLLWWWCTLTVTAGAMFIADPFMNYVLSGGYMPFGFNHMLPAFIGSIVLLLHYRKKWAIIPAALFFVEMLIYANKGSVLTAAVFCLLFVFFMRKLKNKKIMYVVVIVAFLLIVLFELRFVIFDMFYDLALKIGVDSYSLKTFREMLYVSTDRIFSLRTDIWDMCAIELESSWASGIGIGAFQAKHGGYAHNVFLDIAVSSGIFAAILFALILARSIFDFKKYDSDKKTFMFIILMLWLFPMQISLSLWNYAPFWIYFGVHLQSLKIGLKKKEPPTIDQPEEV